MGLAEEIKNPRKFAQEEPVKETFNIDFASLYENLKLAEAPKNISFAPEAEDKT